MGINNVTSPPVIGNAQPVTEQPGTTMSRPAASTATSAGVTDSLSRTQVPESVLAVLYQTGLDLDLGLGGQRFIAGLSAEQQSGMQAMAGALTATVQRSGTGGDLQGRWAEYVSTLAIHGAVDVNALVQEVLRQAYSETNKDLAFYAEKVKFFNACKKAIREELTAARNELALYASGKDTDSITPYAAKGISADFTGSSATGMSPYAYLGEPVNTKGKLDSYIKGLEEKLNSVGDDAQLANVDLQNILQKQQQTLQMMSNISKMLHDTALAVIRKMGG